MKLIKQMNTWNLKKKISFFFTFVILGTTIIILLIYTVSAAYYMMKQSKKMVKAQLRILASNYDDTLEQYQELAIALVIDDSVQQYCKSAENAGSEYEQEAGAVYNYLLNMLNVRSNLNFAVVEKAETGRYVYKGNTSVVDARFDLIYQNDYKRSIPSKEGSSVRMSFGNYYFRDGKCTLTLYHPIYSTSEINEVNGMLIMNLNDNLVEQIYGENSLGVDFELFLMDCTGRTVSNLNQEKIGEKVSYADKIKGSSGSFQESGILGLV